MSVETWRQLLREIISHPEERERLNKELSLDSRTLERWAMGTTKPRSNLLLLLLKTLPQYQYLLPDLMEKEFPEVVEQFRAGTSTDLEKAGVIPPALIERILQQRAFPLDALVLRSIGALMVESLALQLDKGRQGGVTALVVRCVPDEASGGQRIRLLQEYVLDTSLPMPPRNPAYYFGAEPLVGSVVMTGNPQVVNDMDDPLLPVYPFSDEVRSLAAFPICLNGGVAGGLLVWSVQQRYFSKARLVLVKKYSDLLTLAFREDAFFLPEAIDLQTMPHPSAQLVMRVALKQRIHAVLNEAERHQTPTTYAQAERQALQQLLQEAERTQDHDNR